MMKKPKQATTKLPNVNKHLIVFAIVCAAVVVGVLAYVSWYSVNVGQKNSVVDSNLSETKNANDNSAEKVEVDETDISDTEDNDSDATDTEASQSSPNAIDNPTIPSGFTEHVTSRTPGSSYTVYYPSSWKLELSETGDVSTIRNQDGSIEVYIRAFDGGIGGTCGPESDSSQLVQIDAFDMLNYTAGRFAEYVVQEEDGAYNYFAGLQRSNEYIDAVKVGDSGINCKFAFSTTLDDAYDKYTIHGYASISIKSVQGGTKTALDEFNAAINTDDYKIAKQIIQTLYVKK